MVNLEEKALLILYTKPLYFLLSLFLLCSFLQGQNHNPDALVNNVIAQKSFEKQQDRHIAVNDSLEKLSQYTKEFDYLVRIDKRCIETGNKKLEGTVLISIGNFHISCGNYSASLDTFSKAIKVYEILKEYAGQSTVHANMGNAYFYLNDLQKALDYYKLAIGDIKKSSLKKENAEAKMANCYNSLGSIYCSKGDFVFGRTYFDLAYNIWRKHGDSLSISYVYNNYAEIFTQTKKMDSAYQYFSKALKLKVSHGDAYDKADAHNNMSDYYFKMNDPEKGVDYALKALNFLDTTIYSRPLVTTYGLLTEGYNKLKDYRNELKYYKKYKAANDSSDVQGQKSELGRKELQEEFDRIHLTDSIKAVEEIKLKDAKISEKKQQSYFLILILILTVIVLGSIYSRFKLTKKQKLIIEQKNKEITDSINYAKKIQRSSLPNERYIDKELKRLKD